MKLKRKTEQYSLEICTQIAELHAREKSRSNKHDNQDRVTSREEGAEFEMGEELTGVFGDMDGVRFVACVLGIPTFILFFCLMYTLYAFF